MEQSTGKILTVVFVGLVFWACLEVIIKTISWLYN